MEIEQGSPSIEQILTERLQGYTLEDIIRALQTGNIDPAVAIKVAVIKEEEVEGHTIRDSAAEVAPNTRVNAHIHTGGNDPDTQEINGLEVYRVLSGEGAISLGYPKKNDDGSLALDETGNVAVNYDPPLKVKAGSVISVKPGQVHSLRNTSDVDRLAFVFTGNPAHLKNDGDRIMTQNPPQTA